MIVEALRESQLNNPIHCVEDGVELLDYLKHRGRFAGRGAAPRPGLILLDLNMPRMDGREAIGEIRKSPDLCMIPIIVLTTSQAEEDIFRTYELGVNSFITKPVSFEALVAITKTLGRYWFQIVDLPQKPMMEAAE
jgi:CheY-like chemotaxis protein